MKILVGNTKGGVGKTTVAVNLAVARALTGRKVLLVDGDRQGTAQDAIALRSDAGIHPGLSVAQYVTADILRTQVKHQASIYDDIVMDAGGRDSEALRGAMLASDILVVPFLPRTFDVWALTQISEVLKLANTARAELGQEPIKAFAFLNSADPGQGVDNREAAEALADFPLLNFIDAPLRRRKSFANLAGRGMSVLEGVGKEKDEKAIAELKKLVENLF